MDFGTLDIDLGEENLDFSDEGWDFPSHGVAFSEGYRAFFQGLGVDENPYPYGARVDVILHEHWLDGWYEAFDDRGSGISLGDLGVKADGED